ncbi:hypothetical protein [Paenibacillus humicola]|uniref:hypothetical protein n=1 Tax=Paenibacillus humicola TaxID=3110540 RepID=UPI00237A4A55|nr:hypothetical protein [Paenibacillus humicola]
MKKSLLFSLVFAVFFAFTASAVDAKPRGGLKSPRQSITHQPSKPADNVTSSSPGAKTGASAGTTTPNRGFFSGGGLMKGLMIGGLAGLLFGSMFGTGFFGNFMGLIVNLLAIYVLFVIIRSLVTYFRNRRKPGQPDVRRRY